MKNNQVAAFLNQSIAHLFGNPKPALPGNAGKPRVIAALTPAAGQCMERIREALTGQRRLATIARTVTHAAATRLRLALS